MNNKGPVQAGSPFDLIKSHQFKKIEFSEVTENTDLNVLNLNSKLKIYQDLIVSINHPNSKTSKANRNIIKSMLITINNLREKLTAKDTEIKNLKDAQNSNTIANDPPINKDYSSYADSVKNKKKQNLIIIKKKDINENSNLKSVIYDKLNPIKRDIEFKIIKDKKYTMILDVNSEEKQNKIIDQLSDESKIEAKKPKKLIPSILIKNIDRVSTDPNFDYKKYLITEIAQDLNIEENLINVKVIINNTKFRTLRCIINLDQVNTIKVINKGYIKIGYIACQIEKTFKIHRCGFCRSYKHKQEYCPKKESTICEFCAEVHESNQCPAKNDKSKIRCINCSKNHPVFSRECESYIEAYQSLMQKAIC